MTEMIPHQASVFRPQDGSCLIGSSAPDSWLHVT